MIRYTPLICYLTLLFFWISSKNFSTCLKWYIKYMQYLFCCNSKIFSPVIWCIFVSQGFILLNWKFGKGILAKIDVCDYILTFGWDVFSQETYINKSGVSWWIIMNNIKYSKDFVQWSVYHTFTCVLFH